MTDIVFSGEALASFIIFGLLCTLLPIGAVVFYKLKNKDVSLLPAVIGAAIFFVFVLIAEALINAAVIPLITDNTAVYIIYGALAAGVFEETGRLVAYKLILKKHTDPRTSIMYGLGHGGFEAVMLAGVSMLSYAAIGFAINAMGFDAMIDMLTKGDSTVTGLVTDQIGGLAATTLATGALSTWERVVGMTLHISLSVVMFMAVNSKGKMWLYPVAILLHAISDIPAVLYQRGFIGLVPTEIILTAWGVVLAIIGLITYKKLVGANRANRANQL